MLYHWCLFTYISSPCVGLIFKGWWYNDNDTTTVSKHWAANTQWWYTVSQESSVLNCFTLKPWKVTNLPELRKKIFNCQYRWNLLYAWTWKLNSVSTCVIIWWCCSVVAVASWCWYGQLLAMFTLPTFNRSVVGETVKSSYPCDSFQSLQSSLTDLYLPELVLIGVTEM